MSRFFRWDLPSEAPKHPYRDTALLYAVFAALVVLVAWASGGPVGKAIVYAAGFYVVALGWSWWHWRQRLGRRDSSS